MPLNKEHQKWVDDIKNPSILNFIKDQKKEQPIRTMINETRELVNDVSYILANIETRLKDIECELDAHGIEI